MSYLCSGLGDSIDNPSINNMRDFIEALEPHDEEHGAAWFCDDMDNCLEWDINGKLVYSTEAGDRHLLNVSKEQAVKLWVFLLKSDFESIENESWGKGSSPPLTSEQMELREKKQAEMQLEVDRSFYNQLGAEREDVFCKVPGCGSGAIRQSSYCKAHHFENFNKRPCPF